MKKRVNLLLVIILSTTLVIILSITLVSAIFITGEVVTGEVITGKASTGTFNTTIFINSITAPTITLISPADAYLSTDTAYNFTFNVSSEGDVSNCSLILDNSIINLITSVSETSTNGMYNSSLAVGTHTWSINCTDDSNNLGNSSTRTLVITTVVPATTVPGGGAGGGGTKVVSLSIDALSPIFLYETGKIEIPIIINNDGQTTFNNVILTSSVLERGVVINTSMEFSEDFFPYIGPRQKKEVTLIVDISIENLDKEVIITVTSTNPKYETSEKVILNFVGDDIIAVRKMITFLENMIVENPECFELKEMINEARGLFIRGDFNQAILKANNAVKACRVLISKTKETELPERKIDKNILLYLVTGLIIFIVLLIIFSLYKKFRKKKQVKNSKKKIPF